ncbi:GspE/PulE family protein [Candidatus Sumerlaeota bacterium]
MKAQPFRLATICRECGIISDEVFDAVMHRVRPRTQKSRSLVDILKSEVSAETFKELAFFEVTNPFTTMSQGQEATEFFSQTVRFRAEELLGILTANRPDIATLTGIMTAFEPETAKELAKLPGATEAEDGDAVYTALVRRQILTPEFLQRIVSAKRHPYFDANRINFVRRIFSHNGILEAERFDEVLDHAIETGDFFSNVLASKGLLDQQKIKSIFAEPLVLPPVNLRKTPLNEELAGYFPSECVCRDLFLAFEHGPAEIKIALVDPLNFSLVDALSVLTCRQVSSYYAAQEVITENINQQYKGARKAPASATDSAAEDAYDHHSPISIEVQEVDTIVDTMSTVQLVATIVEGALEANATDIHLESEADHLRVRFRIDGVLHKTMEIPEAMMLPVLSRVKVLANLDVTERRRPQDGSFNLDLNGDSFDFRVASIPTNFGEKIVIRALREQSVAAGLGELGLDPSQRKAIEHLLERTYGCILTTGPTGSGKTTTLYTALNMLNTESRNILTIEDPIEYQLAGVNQVPVDLKSDMTFANGLRAALRQDPDVIMVGEVRDADTARVAIRAALTGHLVFTTMHTNTSSGAVMALMQMGMPNYLIASSLIGIIAQRLVRRICDSCKRAIRPAKGLLADLGLSANARPKLYKGRGCDECWSTGYKGRLGVYEVLMVDDEIRAQILENLPEARLQEFAIEHGMQSLQASGLNKIKAGLTTAEEILKNVYMNN